MRLRATSDDLTIVAMPPDDEHLLRAISSGLAEASEGHLFHLPLTSVIDELARLWIGPEARVQEPSPCYERLSESERDYDRPKPSKGRFYRSFSLPPIPTKRPPPWYLGMSAEFLKQVGSVDRKLQGRILEALTDLTKNPIELRGDTVKPLSGEFRGCWRYRIGDYRLIYSPNPDTGDITLLTFASRGAAYD